MSITAKNTWSKLSKEEQGKKMFNMRLSIPSGIKSSSLEYRIKEILDKNNIPYIHQYFLSYFSYDFCFKNYVLLEVQGDYWHASPLIYKANDSIPYGKGTKLASEIWDRDLIKKLSAEKYGNRVAYLWESEINSMSDEEILLFVRKINEN